MDKKINIIVLFFSLGMQFCFAANSDTTKIYFDIDKKDINRFSYKLDSVALIKNIERISIIGYTDYLGSDEYNLKLSLKRANAVKNYLSKKISSIPISASGKGEIASGIELPLGEPENRRVDIIIIRNPTFDNSLTKSISQSNNVVSSVEDIQQIEVGETLVLGSLRFIGGRHFLLPGSEPQLSILYNALKENPRLKIEIQGHICCTTMYDGYDYDTQDNILSVNRAKYIYERLVTMGISRSRLSYKGFGSKYPRNWPEITEEDKSANRRVEIKILEK